jgi:hypothetical protein
LEQGLQALQLGLIYRPGIAGRRHIRRAKIGGGVTLKSLNYDEVRDSGGGLEFNPGRVEDPGIARPQLKEGWQGHHLIPPGPALARPLQRAGKSSFLADFQVYLNLIR